MKYGKLMAKLFAQRSNTNAQVAVALIAGLAAGAVISILFAPASGEDSRRRIADGARNLGDGVRNSYGSLMRKLKREKHEELAAETEVPHFVNAPASKKRKSDIKDLVADAPLNEEHS